MKFAVVEYSSKTGKIWKHTPERPNYLCDPVKEIDPTSFGCYVSALEGEHIPLTTFAIGEKAQLSSLQTLWRKAVKRTTGDWPAYDISYFKQFDAVLIVHQISDGHEVTMFTKRLKRDYPHIKILGVPTQPYGILRTYWEHHPEWLASFQDFIDACDVFITIVASTKHVWQEMSKTQVIYLPQPYPVEFAQQYFKPRKAKENIIFVAGVTERDNIRKGQRAAVALQKKFPDYVIQVTKIPGMALDTSELKGSRFEVIEFEPWQQHLQYLSRPMIVLNTDYTQTRGRVQVDCAAVGTPSIGADSDGQIDLFPELPASPTTTVNELTNQATRLLEDPVFYSQVVDSARDRMKEYSYEVSAQRIQSLIQTL